MNKVLYLTGEGSFCFGLCSSLFGLGLLVRDLPDEDGVLWHGGKLILEHVGTRDGQALPIAGKRQGGYGGGVFVELAKPLLVEAVPDIDISVRAARSEGPVAGVETDGIDGIHLL